MNEEVHWQVALLSMHYTNNLNNFQELCTLRIIAEKPAADEIDNSERQARECVTVGATVVSSPELDTLDKALVASFINSTDANVAAIQTNELEAPATASKEYLFGKVQLVPKRYENVVAVCEDMVSQINSIFQPRFGLRVRAVCSSDGKISLTLRNGASMVIYADNAYIGRALGLKTEAKAIDVKDDESKAETREVTLYALSMDGEGKARLDGVQALYVYADLVQYQYVGDTMAPLLAYVDIAESPGRRVGHICNPLVYLSVDKSAIDTISIRICDEHGSDVKFSDDESVVVRLHFRKAKQFVPFAF
jgi:hypothetical protein